jgi:hypothetical protein
MTGLSSSVAITVRWPSGITETFGSPSGVDAIKAESAVRIDRIIKLTEGTGQPVVQPSQ